MALYPLVIPYFVLQPEKVESEMTLLTISLLLNVVRELLFLLLK